MKKLVFGLVAVMLFSFEGKANEKNIIGYEKDGKISIEQRKLSGIQEGFTNFLSDNKPEDNLTSFEIKFKLDKPDNSNYYNLSDEFIIGKVVNGKFVIIIDKEKLIEDAEVEWKKKGYVYDLVDVEIIESIPENDTSLKFYILHFFSKKHDINIGYFVSLSSDSFYFRGLSLDAGVSCTSTQCQFGCNPTSLINPSTKKPVLTCSSCDNECTKTSTVGG